MEDLGKDSGEKLDRKIAAQEASIRRLKAFFPKFLTFAFIGMGLLARGEIDFYAIGIVVMIWAGIKHNDFLLGVGKKSKEQARMAVAVSAACVLMGFLVQGIVDFYAMGVCGLVWFFGIKKHNVSHKDS